MKINNSILKYSYNLVDYKFAVSENKLKIHPFKKNNNNEKLFTTVANRFGSSYFLL